ncbi:MAG: hypothetical protein N2486_01515 [Caloramator sp.]|nr:hypothetical protein [Caloramator sp.]
MSCTVFYKGKLKDEYTFKDIVSIIEKHAKFLECKLNISDISLELIFLKGKSEPLVLSLENNKINGFFKWNGIDEEEYYKILDMFIDLKPLFKSYKIEDDLGICDNYIIQNKPCKIIIRPILNDKEQKLLQRILENINKKYSDTELELLNIMYRYSDISPFSENICRIIIQDFIKIFDIKSSISEKYNNILKVANEINWFDGYLTFTEENFIFEFIYIVVAVWINYCLSYKNKGLVKDLSNNIRGLESSKLAAIYGITSNFLNCHTGTVNSKHAEINKFMQKFYSNSNPFTLSQLGAETELILLITILDYLGFKYNLET